MFKVSSLGLILAKLLMGLLIAEAALSGGLRLLARRRPIITPPRQIADWVAREADPPVSNGQRDYPNLISVDYYNPDQPPVSLCIAAVQSINDLRMPQKYMVDSDSRVSPVQIEVLKRRKRDAYVIRVIQGIDLNIIDVHWFQRPGSLPIPYYTDKTSDAIKAIVFKRPSLYSCDLWLPIHPSTNGAQSRYLLQKFADTLSDVIAQGG